jgi:hypothetical protein
MPANLLSSPPITACSGGSAPAAHRRRRRQRPSGVAGRHASALPVDWNCSVSYLPRYGSPFRLLVCDWILDPVGLLYTGWTMGSRALDPHAPIWLALRDGQRRLYRWCWLYRRHLRLVGLPAGSFH